MTADPATYSVSFVIVEGGRSSRRSDPVHARVIGGQQLVNSQRLRIEPADRVAVETAHCGRDFPPGIRGGGPHPYDVLYWVACLGGAGLLLLCATT
jgi:hypothetical protein